jgi:hypothetical protein
MGRRAGAHPLGGVSHGPQMEECVLMMRPGFRATGGLSALLVAAALLAMPATAAAATNPTIAQTGGMSATLPILGGGVAVTVALDPAGNITGVTVGNPALAQTKATSEFVKFATADGKTKVTVKARGSRLAISARVTTLAELVGTGTWTADVFGTGTKTSVSYTIGDDGKGNPTVSLGTPAPLPASATWTAGTPKSGKGDGGASASSGGSFAYQGFTKKLTVSVRVEKPDGEDPGGASLRITVSGRDVQKLADSLAALNAAGTHAWSAYLCDGKTAVTVSYHVNLDGTIGFDGATGGAFTQTTKDGALRVRFKGSNVGVAVSLKNNGDGTYTLRVKGSSGLCGKGEGHHKGGGDSHASAGGSGGDTRTRDSHTGDSRTGYSRTGASLAGFGGGHH